MPTLRQLSYLVALADHLHFRRAAESVHVTQPTLSAQLQQLEKRLGADLVERGGPVVLTPLGRELAERARAVLAQVEEIRALAAASPHGHTGTIRLGVPPTLGPYLLPHIVPRLHAAHPQLKLYVREGRPSDLQAGLGAGTFDLVISPLPIAGGDLAVEALFREPLRIAVAPDHRLAGAGTGRSERAGRIERADLADEAVLSIEPGHHLHEQVAALCEDYGARLLRDYEGTSLDTLRLMVGMGVGLAFLPALYVRSEIGERGELVVLDLAVNPYRQIGLAWRARSVHAPLFEQIGGLIREVADDLREIEVIGP